MLNTLLLARDCYFIVIEFETDCLDLFRMLISGRVHYVYDGGIDEGKLLFRPTAQPCENLMITMQIIRYVLGWRNLRLN
ncbi:hypothetical protein P8452_08816 [Trifolium repens]|nr:hypothetical protein P8452_08816 [Trifolium repens]